jgi:thiol-disulfide isomerase/thioredoxin
MFVIVRVRLYDNNILIESHTKPYLIYIYTDFCIQCRMLDPVWEQAEQDLEKIGSLLGLVLNCLCLVQVTVAFLICPPLSFRLSD